MIPTWLLQTSDKSMVVGTPWNGEQDKKLMILVMRDMLKQEGALSYSFMSEAWAATEDLKHPTGLQPSQREDRREVVIINACDHNGGKMRVYEMKRGANGRVSALVQDQTEADHFEGRLFNLFKDQDSHAD
jgi:hypothetical protein